MKSNTDLAKRNKRTGCTDMKAITDNAVQRSKQLLTLLLCAGLLLVSVPVHAGKITRYVHTDHLGSPVAKTDSTGAVIWRQSYTPYGEDYQQADPDGPGFTGHRSDAASGLVYMQVRYYDPEIGRFLSVDPVTFAPDQPQQFNRYWYANGNPYSYIDPDGHAGTLALGAPFIIKSSPVAAKAIAAAPWAAAVTVSALGGAAIGTAIYESNATAIQDGLDAVFNESADSADNNQENTNPYDGAVTDPVVVVDSDGNAIPVNAGEKIDASPNGDYQQVKDNSGNPTGTRLDKGGHPNQSDPKAQAPHAHRPNVTDETGNPHLPINSRDL